MLGREIENRNLTNAQNGCHSSSHILLSVNDGPYPLVVVGLLNERGELWDG